MSATLSGGLPDAKRLGHSWRAKVGKFSRVPKVIAQKAASTLHVLDRFHIVQHLNKAIDEVRASEARQMKADGFEPLLKHSRWCLLKRPGNRTDKQDLKLADLCGTT